MGIATISACVAVGNGPHCVFTKTMVQGPTCLANVGAGAFSTWDAVHHTFPAIVVYSIPCAECPRTYIGQTGRSLDHRLREHRRALKNGDLGSSALAEHVFSTNHQVDLSKAMVIDTHNHTQTRCMLESWNIQHHQSTLNREKGTLPGLYAALLS